MQLLTISIVAKEELISFLIVVDVGICFYYGIISKLNLVYVRFRPYGKYHFEILILIIFLFRQMGFWGFGVLGFRGKVLSL